MKPILKPPKMNKLELRYSTQLQMLKQTGKIIDWKFEELRFMLGNGAWYKPDFLIVKTNVYEIHETKGFWREAARVRIKTAAYRFPWFKWCAVQWINERWEYEEF